MKKVPFIAVLFVFLLAGSAFATDMPWRVPLGVIRFENGGVGSAYNSSATASGDTEPYSWTFVSGTIPPGLDFTGSMNSKTITLQGTPAKAGEYKFVMTLKSANYERDFTFTIQIYARDKWLDELERLNDNLEGNNNNTNSGGSSGSSGGGCETGFVGLWCIGLILMGAGVRHKIR